MKNEQYLTIIKPIIDQHYTLLLRLVRTLLVYSREKWILSTRQVITLSIIDFRFPCTELISGGDPFRTFLPTFFQLSTSLCLRLKGVCTVKTFFDCLLCATLFSISRGDTTMPPAVIWAQILLMKWLFVYVTMYYRKGQHQASIHVQCVDDVLCSVLSRISWKVPPTASIYWLADSDRLTEKELDKRSHSCRWKRPQLMMKLAMWPSVYSHHRLVLFLSQACLWHDGVSGEQGIWNST